MDRTTNALTADELARGHGGINLTTSPTLTATGQRDLNAGLSDQANTILRTAINWYLATHSY